MYHYLNCENDTVVLTVVFLKTQKLPITRTMNFIFASFSPALELMCMHVTDTYLCWNHRSCHFLINAAFLFIQKPSFYTCTERDSSNICVMLFFKSKTVFADDTGLPKICYIAYKLLELINEVNKVAEYDVQELTVSLYTGSKQMENFKCQLVIECDTIVMATINQPAANLTGPGRPRALPPSWGAAAAELQAPLVPWRAFHAMFLSVVLALLVSSPRRKRTCIVGELRLSNLSFISNFHTQQIFQNKLCLLAELLLSPNRDNSTGVSGCFSTSCQALLSP